MSRERANGGVGGARSGGAGSSGGGGDSGAPGRFFDVARFHALRQQQRLGFGAPLVCAHETASTNGDALATARAGAASDSAGCSGSGAESISSAGCSGSGGGSGSGSGSGSGGGEGEGAPARFFDIARFHALRLQRRLGFGAPLVYARETGSTNDDALAAARAGGASGSVFLADHQTQGRGRRGKTWLAAPGQHLLFSILLREVQPPAGAGSDGSAARDAAGVSAGAGVGALTLAVGLGVREALAARAGVALSVPLRLKWPNDVLAGTRKLAGILCEGQFVGSRLDAVVIGIGINVRHASYPPELADQVACLEALGVSGAGLEREALLVEVLAAVEARVETYRGEGFGALLDEFTRHDALSGERVEVSGASPIVGIARGVDAGGRLLVESDGLIVPVISGTVRAVQR